MTPIKQCLIINQTEIKERLKTLTTTQKNLWPELVDLEINILNKILKNSVSLEPFVTDMVNHIADEAIDFYDETPKTPKFDKKWSLEYLLANTKIKL